eukprot:CAMPEP_0173381128 /NCGR_PEP_ID=MMETSP1356-20130122/3596_1 /TAXON_ID=77927 ORGANISM="Hemiselmis virescens, Strain PCC157" /NCGR_SAMPLE_ID=MMETSP1356 /ASSEMBLY_ACC=CAM_ASM_000847 /LENGTH=349 /DNA_ID=CAMNT_0014334879 /DNA_START=29 /DNA_END=1078 /DNA_ORIENTATION=+
MWGDTVTPVKLARPQSDQYVTPSLGFNVLTSHGASLAYPHLTDVIVIPSTSAPKTERGTLPCLALKCGETVVQTSLLSTKPSDPESPAVLVCMTLSGVQVWDPQTAKKLAAITLPEGDPGPAERQSFAKGAVIVPRADGRHSLIVGSSTGYLHEIDTEGFRFAYNSKLEAYSHSSPIADISSTHEPMYSEAALPPQCSFASACEGGKICVWDATLLNPLAEMHAPGDCITAVRLRAHLAIASTTLGKVMIFHIESRAVLAEIQAHARACAGIAIHPMSLMVASVAEDSHCIVWNLDRVDANEIEVIASTSIKDKLLCGVCFTGERGKDLHLASFDSESIFHLEGDILTK